MSIEKIIERIEIEANEEVQKILSKAQFRIDQQKESLAKKMTELEGKVKSKGKQIDNEIKNSFLLPAKLQVRSLELNAKRKVINLAFERAMEFSDEDYKKVLGYLFSAVSDFNGATLYPYKGKEKIITDFVNENNYAVNVGESLDDIGGGFILEKGKIKYDCTFVTLTKKLKEKLEPKLGEMFK